MCVVSGLETLMEPNFAYIHRPLVGGETRGADSSFLSKVTLGL